MFRAVVLLSLAVLTGFPAHSAKAGPKTAVVIVDLQWEFLLTFIGPPAFRVNRFIQAQKRLLSWAKAQGYPVLVFEYDPLELGKTVPDILSHVQSFQMNAVVPKVRDDGFHLRAEGEIQPEKILKKWGVERLIVAGVNATGCVQSTITSALSRGFQVAVAAETVADHYEQKMKRYDASSLAMEWKALLASHSESLSVVDRIFDLPDFIPSSQRKCARYFERSGMVIRR